MSILVNPDDGPFVFGAYAAHLDRIGSLPRPVEVEPPPVEAVEPAEDDELGSIAC
jgi:hypothetical protein